MCWPYQYYEALAECESEDLDEDESGPDDKTDDPTSSPSPLILFSRYLMVPLGPRPKATDRVGWGGTFCFCVSV